MFSDQLRRLAAKALAKGGRLTSPGTVEVDWSSYCQTPVTVERYARKDRGQTTENRWSPGEEVPIRVIMRVHCRQCDECRKAKGRMWYNKARIETFRATRTWFGTFTWDPHYRATAEMITRQRLAKSGVDWKTLSPSEQFVESCIELGEDITLWLKRLREASRAPFRYLLVWEAHKSGLPHAHILVHEQDAAKTISKRKLQGQWRLGHSAFRLVKDYDGVGYACKYVSKSLLGSRVRASQHYGEYLEPATVSNHNTQDQQEGVRGNLGAPVPAQQDQNGPGVCDVSAPRSGEGGYDLPSPSNAFVGCQTLTLGYANVTTTSKARGCTLDETLEGNCTKPPCQEGTQHRAGGVGLRHTQRAAFRAR